MAKGIWATWFDVDDDNREEFLSWLHNTHLPELASDKRYEWVAQYQSRAKSEELARVWNSVLSRTDADIGTGTQFVVLVGANSPTVFFNPQVLDREDSPQLRMRRGIRHAVLLEHERANGPAMTSAIGEMPGPIIQFGCYQPISVEAEFEINRWYIQNRIPTMSKMPGCIRVRKFSCLAGWLKHSVIYEFDSLESRRIHFEEAVEMKALNPPPGHWTVGRFTMHAPGSPTLGERKWPL